MQQAPEPKLNQMLHGVILRQFENEKRSQPLAHHCKEFRSDSGVSTDLSCKVQRNLLLVQKSRPGMTYNFWILLCLLESLTFDFLQSLQLGQALREKCTIQLQYKISAPRESVFGVVAIT